MPQFTFSGYRDLLQLIRDNGYTFSSYENWPNYDKCAILRHDIDYQPEKAVQLARLEHDNEIKSTFFILVTSDFYNPFSYTNSEFWKEIVLYGHHLGLHFDEVRYDGNIESIKEKILEEKDLLEHATHQKINVVSMHRPSKEILESNLDFSEGGVINSYSNTYFKEFKYLSDSRRRWREPVEEIIRSGEFKRLHILTHAFWYNEIEIGIHDSISAFVRKGNCDRYQVFKDNITDLNAIMSADEAN